MMNTYDKRKQCEKKILNRDCFFVSAVSFIALRIEHDTFFLRNKKCINDESK